MINAINRQLHGTKLMVHGTNTDLLQRFSKEVMIKEIIKDEKYLSLVGGKNSSGRI